MLLNRILGFSISDDHGYLWKTFPGATGFREDVLQKVVDGVACRRG